MIEELQHKVTAARALLDRMSNSHFAAQATLREAKDRLDHAQELARKDREDALLQDRRANAKLSAVIPGLQSEYEQAEQQMQAARGALETAQASLTQAEAELMANQDALLRRAFAPELERFEQALVVLTDTAAAIRKRLELTGPAGLVDLFAPRAHDAEWIADEYRGARVRAFNAGFDLLNTRAGESLYRRAS